MFNEAHCSISTLANPSPSKLTPLPVVLEPPFSKTKVLLSTEASCSPKPRNVFQHRAGEWRTWKFHYYALGRHVTVETDHYKLLEAIFKKHLSSAPPRIARVMLRIQKYDVNINYLPGKDIPLADTLSRLIPCPADTIQGLDVSVHELHLHLNAKDPTSDTM